jgi:molybdopterin-guanine dinucleotide biosynthesis protein A
LSQDGPVRGAILAGGGATRFGGRPKGLETVGGARILDRLADVLASALGSAPLLVANAPEAEEWRPDLRVVRDLRPGLGALGGIYTAVVEAPAPVVCVAWDMPFVTAALVRRLAGGLAGADAVLPRSDGRRGAEPMCAAYGPACRDAIAASLDAGDRRAIAFHARIRVDILPLTDVERCGDPAVLFFNVNTADDLARADELWRRLASSPSSDARTPARPR